MRLKVFLDTNVLLSGIFFDGNEAKIIGLVEIDLITCEDAVDELKAVVRRKLKYLKDRTLEIALSEVERALSDMAIIPRSKYRHKLMEAQGLISHKKDAHILAAVLQTKPDYFLTGDAHFFAESVQGRVRVMTAKDFLSEIS